MSINEAERFSISVRIRDTTTDEARTYRMRERMDVDVNFLWSDGNLGCDCNRARFFALAANLPDPDAECGEGRYKVESILDDRDGRILYGE